MRSIAFAALLVAVPSAAQAELYGPPAPGDEKAPVVVEVSVIPGSQALGQDLEEVRDRIRQQRESGAISKREAKALRRQAGLIDALAERYGADGLSDPERRELELRAQVLRAETAFPRPR